MTLCEECCSKVAPHHKIRNEVASKPQEGHSLIARRTEWAKKTRPENGYGGDSGEGVYGWNSRNSCMTDLWRKGIHTSSQRLTQHPRVKKCNLAARRLFFIHPQVRILSATTHEATRPNLYPCYHRSHNRFHRRGVLNPLPSAPMHPLHLRLNSVALPIIIAARLYRVHLVILDYPHFSLLTTTYRWFSPRLGGHSTLAFQLSSSGLQLVDGLH